MPTNAKRLSLTISNDQLRKLQPLIDESGEVKIAGTLEGNQLRISFIACNAAFLACNAAFQVVGKRA